MALVKNAYGQWVEVPDINQTKITPEAAAINKKVAGVAPLSQLELAKEASLADKARKEKFVKGITNIPGDIAQAAFSKDFLSKIGIVAGVPPASTASMVGPTSVTGVRTPVAEELTNITDQGAAPVAKSPATGGTGGIDLRNLPTSAIDQTAPAISGKQLPAWAPTPEAPTPAPTPTLWQKTKGIAKGIGKWAEDPKIARALLTSGASILSTGPSATPISNAQMLGKGILSGIGAYDTEAAKEAAAKETARKAGIEGRETTVKESAVVGELGKIYTPASLGKFNKTNNPADLVNIKTGQPVKVMETNVYSKNNKFWRDRLDENTGKLIDTVEVSRLQAEGQKGEGGKPEEKYKQTMAALNARFINPVREKIAAMGLSPEDAQKMLVAAENSPGSFAALLPAEHQRVYLDAASRLTGIDPVTNIVTAAGGSPISGAQEDWKLYNQ